MTLSSGNISSPPTSSSARPKKAAQAVRSADVDLPSSIYAWPQSNAYSASRVLIRGFHQPDYVQGVGDYAAQVLYRQLLTQDVFQDVRLDLEAEDRSSRAKMRTLDRPDCDLLITGTVHYFVDSGSQQQSKVVTEVRVEEKAGGSLHTVWHMRTAVVGEAKPPKDLYLVRLAAAPAPSGQELLQRCAEQLANAMLYVPPREE